MKTHPQKISRAGRQTSLQEKMTSASPHLDSEEMSCDVEIRRVQKLQSCLIN